MLNLVIHRYDILPIVDWGEREGFEISKGLKLADMVGQQNQGLWNGREKENIFGGAHSIQDQRAN